MMWHYFPIGFRFPVEDFSEETKRRCWQTTLAALSAADGFGATLFDTEQPYDYGSDGPVFVCIACFENIKQSRAVAKKLYAQDALMTELALHHPFFQANDLESFGPYPQLGTLYADGTVTYTETYAAYIPQSVQPAKSNACARLLLAAEPNDALCAETVTRLLGRAASQAQYRVFRVLLPNGENGIVRALVTARNGRFESVPYRDAEGVQQTETIGILPGSLAALEPTAPAAAIEAAYSFGYRRFLTGQSGNTQALQTLGETCAVETADADAILESIDIDILAERADGVVLALHSDANAKSVLQRLQPTNKPVVLLTAQSILDREPLMHAFPFLRDIVTCSLTADALQQALLHAAPKLLKA